MILRKADTFTTELMQDFGKRALEEREGIHASDLDLCLAKSYWRKTDPIAPTIDQLLLFAIGFALQYIILGKAAETELGPVDSISMTVDGIINDEHVIEFKVTRRSLNKFNLKEQGSWLRRTMMYCYAAGRQKAYVTVLFLQGDYKPPRPMIESWELEFSGEELYENWQEMLGRKATLEKALWEPMTSELLADLSYTREDWECEKCENFERCFRINPEIFAKGAK